MLAEDVALDRRRNRAAVLNIPYCEKLTEDDMEMVVSALRGLAAAR